MNTPIKGMGEDRPTTLERREAALLEMRFRALARAGTAVVGAYVNNPPTVRLRWGYIGKPFTRE